MTDKTREDFHSWMRDRFWVGVNLVRSPDGYVSTVLHPSLPMTYASVEMMWESYQSATQRSAARIAELEAEVQALRRDAERLTVLYRSMPESCGRTNWTALLFVKGKGDFTIARSEYPHRVRYEADRLRWLIGELQKEPFILDYDADEKTPCHLCGGTGEKDGKPCPGLNFRGTSHPSIDAAIEAERGGA